MYVREQNTPDEQRDKAIETEGESDEGKEIINANASQKPDRLELSEVTAVFGGC